jgi:hypothetical protein
VQNADFLRVAEAEKGRLRMKCHARSKKSDKKRAVDDEKFGKYFFGIWAVFFRKYS